MHRCFALMTTPTPSAPDSAITALADYDLILCGKQTTDGDTAQVGAEMAEFLNIPHYANIQTVTQTEDGKLLRSVSQVELGDRITVHLGDGNLSATVMDKKENVG